jgi:hypothetical protein
MLVAASLACAHGPKQPRFRNQTDEIVARGIFNATRVLEPAAAYQIQVLTGSETVRVLPLAAQYSKLVVEGPALLRRKEGGSTGVVRITIIALERASESEVVLRFSYVVGDSPPSTCAVGILTDDAAPASWAFRPMGEEHCWPRPSRAGARSSTTPSNKELKLTKPGTVGAS